MLESRMDIGVPGDMKDREGRRAVPCGLLRTRRSSRPLRHRRFVERARVARLPAARIDLRQELCRDAIEKIRLFEIDRVSGARDHRQPRRWADALDENSRLEAIIVLVATDHVQWPLELRQSPFA